MPGFVIARRNLELLHGQPAAALSQHATQLAETSKVPVLLVTADRGSTGAT